MFYCRGGCGKRVHAHQYRCNKCAKRAIVDNNLSKVDGNLVYGLYNHADELVYIGVTNSATRRVSQHLESKFFKRMEIIKRFDNRQEANDFEIFAIWNLRPPLNIKIDKPARPFDFLELDSFGKVAAEAPKKQQRVCKVCSTVLNRHNNSEFCLRHRPKPKRNKKKRRRAKKAQDFRNVV